MILGETSTVEEAYIYGDAVVSLGNLTVTGEGSLFVTSADDGIEVDGDILTIESGKISIGYTEFDDNGEILNKIEVKDDGIDINSGNLVINGGEITIVSDDHGADIVGNITINGGKLDIKAGDDGLNAEYNVTINGGSITIDTEDYGIDSDSGSVFISDGVVKILTKNNDGIDATKEIKISGGNICVLANEDGLEAGKLTINGGTIELKGGICVIDGADIKIDENIWMYDESYKVTVGVDLKETNYIILSSESPAAKVVVKDGVEPVVNTYMTLEKAVHEAKIKENSIIVLLRDVALEETVEVNSGKFTLDLNGKKITTTAVDGIKIVGSTVDFTLLDSGENGKIENISTKKEANVINISSNATVNIKGGELCSNEGSVIINKGKLNIYDGIIIGAQNTIYNVEGKVLIAGGEFPEGLGIYDYKNELNLNNILVEDCFYRNKDENIITVDKDAKKVGGYVKVISGATLNDAVITLEKEEFEYIVEGVEPKVTVMIGQYTVNSNEYTVTYTNNKAIGVATVTITATENAKYRGSVSKEFKIIPTPIKENIAPVSGDNSNVCLWLVLLAVSGGVLVTYNVNKKRKTVN